MENKALMDTSFSSTRRDYEVFLSFSGKDTRKKFTAHLYTALDNKGVHTFLDDEELRIGEEIGPALFNAIEQSRISIPIFSQNYASSKWCLQELDKVLQCYQRNHQIVLPIFLDVEPSDVRNQTGNFGNAFRKRKKNEEPLIENWSTALTEIGTRKGWVLSEVENGDESKLIRLVVERVLGELNKTPLTVTEHPIGLNSHVEYLLSLLNVESMNSPTDTKFVGICGMGGIGKTTMAKAVYNKIIKNFDGCSFLDEVREQASKHRGLVHLQNQLLNDIFGKIKYEISQADGGSQLIKERLQGRKILLILDDVDHPRQLNALAGGISWFGPGSRIIITTRDEHVLKLGEVTNNNIYKPEGLDEKQSLQLFSMHAFRKDQPPEDYMQLSKNMVSHAGGLPLTLEVLGSFLFDMNGKEKWECALQKLEKVLPDEVQNKLKISYDGLEEEEKDIFLDVACYFIGMKKDDAIYIWEACKFYPNTGLEVLIRKSLVRIGDNNELRMHDQLRDMGRGIVYVQSRREPGERTRLWSREEVMEVLQEHTGTRKVEGISLDFRSCTHPSSLGEIEEERETGEHFRIEDFSTMSNLRLLQVNGIDLEGNIEHLPSKIRWLCWQRCPLKIFPSKFYIEKLVVLDLSNSDIRQAWNSGLQNKQFKNMKVLNLSCCLNLVKSPDFSGFPQLNKLILENCTALVDVHESIVHLKKLVRLNLSGCIKITELPGSISTLHSLQQLILSSCYQLGKLPESIGYLRSLEELRLDDDKKINELPNSIENLSRLRCLSLINCHSLTRIPKSIRRITSLVELYLGGSSIVEIPDGIESLEKLEKVSIKDCPNINSIPKLPSSLNYLDTSCCTLLKGLPDLSTLKNLRTLRLDGCDTLLWGTEGILLGEGIQGIEGAESLEDLYVSCLMCFDIPAQDSFNNQPSSSSGIQQRYVIGINEINNGISLCLDFEQKEDIWIIPRGTLIFETHIHKNGKQIRCTTSLHIEGMGPETTSIQMDGRKKISAHYSQGLNWFGIPLKITDEIGIERVETFGELRRLNVKCFIVLPH